VQRDKEFQRIQASREKDKLKNPFNLFYFYNESMQTEKTEGIVLRSQDYKERDRLITLFTPEGLLSLIVKGISRKNSRLLSLTTPFCHGEYLYRVGSSELFRFQDGSILDDGLTLRSKLSHLQTAGSLAQAILSSQMPKKDSPALFALYRSYQKQIPSFSDGAPLLASFYLKLLKHEGLLHLSDCCMHCEAPAQSLERGESVCQRHRGEEGILFSKEEWAKLLSLQDAQQFSSLQTVDISAAFVCKVAHLFDLLKC